MTVMSIDCKLAPMLVRLSAKAGIYSVQHMSSVIIDLFIGIYRLFKFRTDYKLSLAYVQYLVIIATQQAKNLRETYEFKLLRL